MKAITIENLIAHIRPLRTGKTFLCKFINDCEIIDVVPMETIDKIRAEIEQLTSRYTISRERGGMGQVEWSDMLIKESEVLEIIDKYKGESEE